MRINKYMAHKKLTTRREADRLIEAGKVRVNGVVATLGQQISEKDEVTLDAKNVKKRVYLAYFKPRGVITHSPEAHEEDIVTRIHKDYGITNVFPIGRLDKDSEGIIILTNDGRITGPLLNPDRGNEKEYTVTVDKKVTGDFLKKLEHGVDIEGYITKPAIATKHKSDNHVFTLVITEGKKHQIRRMCAALGYQTQKLQRVRMLTIKQLNLKSGQFRHIKGKEQEVFLEKLELKST